MIDAENSRVYRKILCADNAYAVRADELILPPRGKVTQAA